MNKASRLFWPVLVTPKNAVVKQTEQLSRSQKLLTELGLVKSGSNGTYQIMPIAQRSVEKLIGLVDGNMQRAGGQKISLPILTPTGLWKKTGRLEGDISEFYMVRDRSGKQFLMSPTHEEAVTAMVATTAPISYRQLPLRLYQIGPKFRDELKSRFGLMRAKEFLMKDMYTFDVSEETARDTYSRVSAAYDRLFKQLEVPFVKVNAATGMMGGSLSHEYHYVSPVGEDTLMQCSACGFAGNAEVLDSATTECPNCRSSQLSQVRGVEVAHTFLLGEKYSKPLGATYLNTSGKPQSLVMGCYGIGITRVLASALEVLSTDQELRWPKLLAPYDVCLIGPKQGSKEQQPAEAVENELLQHLGQICGAQELLHDDRKELTIGKRLLDAKRLGHPLTIVVGARAVQQEAPKLELHVSGGEKLELDISEALKLVAEHSRQKKSLLAGRVREVEESRISQSIGHQL
ncbi:probable proline--tRNA ligase, mitochondrial isoform X1 [Drosophila guanche]|uniref:Probable proline--tRNA ligase, mitochondrial n=3 Tax=Drosophila guanche TaxID=7266 RepID=A0A3B0KMU1_DROGU|nr:probable proline--tRNA ligase, mitochondrial isoform X1 [Drosophila guanche]SPP87156.1 blast:Deoxynucleotidyltransferase terminal-interacting protein 1 [Drosophila guanche]